MTAKKLVLTMVSAAGTLALLTQGMAAQTSTVGSNSIQHVLLLSIDGMHAVDFYNCANGIASINNGNSYCPNLAALSQTGINYVATASSMPSDSFPGIAALRFA
jgi:predicted AlkP superfamily pyrophosphatase or phosphodiesterase